ncbi:MAG: AgmX/PglI C-terminal domain-containing protein [Polyangiaceae bacterium]|nr:AgmX/PglI C-terminal domain-containing protein [Polyangiaceae bacterium]
MKLKKLTATILYLGGITIACGGTETPVRHPVAPQEPEDDGDQSGIVMSSEIGGLNEDAVEAAFSGSSNSLEHCFRKGVDRVEFLGGEAGFSIKIDQSGSIVSARLEKSTLGDRATENCMLKALKARNWPKPVGGRTGVAQKSFAFDPAGGRPAATLDERFAADVVRRPEFKEAVQGCVGSSAGTFTATAYVDTSGKVLAASATAPDDASEQAVDCIADAISSMQFPSPGSWPGKVTFQF